ncbi:Dna replication protein-like protein [Thalictrum thalictroides]|uniref:Dna replication protein-like protein n=1 Tax=Thalictrum thalictroides TaxID=46969 RepID=A0A7J6WBG9_THATH|nr:Dna replication protein-like protein [Thalictrum thalictroides]
MASGSEEGLWFGFGSGSGDLDLDPSIAMTTDEETVEEYDGNGTDPLTVSLYQMDLDRTVSFEIISSNSFTEGGQNIEKYPTHISKTDTWNRLSEQEQKFAKRCMDDMEKHLTQSVLSRLPYGYQSILKQSISSEEDDMVLADSRCLNGVILS